ncbi:MAG: hypothetical protein HXX10_02985 [Rhodoplanes sp.]|uniref:hypothetical protein n=1 Tax=Rhodoplanes sp. TaxID=1968906 RepID=UPI0017CFE8B5|nr:hypothetical protein [Rhodoplanes sp.]NVO12980.1 hypothetical protein [Rhodoplanes sp.]
MHDESTVAKRSPFERLVRELREFGILAAYLYVWFAALVYYKAAILQAEGIAFAPWAFAAVKALVTAKFMLVGRALHIGDGYGKRPLIVPTLYRTVIFLVLVGVLTVIEEATLALVHGKPLWDGVAEIGGGTLHLVIATTALMFLTFFPYFAFRALADVIGEETLRRLYFEARRRD